MRYTIHGADTIDANSFCSFYTAELVLLLESLSVNKEKTYDQDSEKLLQPFTQQNIRNKQYQKQWCNNKVNILIKTDTFIQPFKFNFKKS